MAIKVTKKEVKRNKGPNAQTRRSLNCGNQVMMQDGAVYMGKDAQFMDVGMGLGYQKMAAGTPYVKVKGAA